MTTERVCKDCGKTKGLSSFKAQLNGDRTKVCTACLLRRERQANPDRFRKAAARKRQRHPDAAVLTDCRSSDRKRGFAGNDLDRSFVASKLAEGCSYCGCTDMRITLDRIDNRKAHDKSNVVPACLRCNYMRGSMPYEAWIHITPAVKEARERGLFGDWRSVPFNRKYSSDLAQLAESAAVTGVVPGSKPGVGAEAKKPLIDCNPSPRISKSRRFPPVEEVRVMVQASSLRVVAELLGCSHVTIWKYLARSSAAEQSPVKRSVTGSIPVG